MSIILQSLSSLGLKRKNKFLNDHFLATADAAKDSAGSIVGPKVGDTLQELAQDLTVSEKTSPPIYEGLADIFKGYLSGKIVPDDKLKVKFDIESNCNLVMFLNLSLWPARSASP